MPKYSRIQENTNFSLVPEPYLISFFKKFETIFLKNNMTKFPILETELNSIKNSIVMPEIIQFDSHTIFAYGVRTK